MRIPFYQIDAFTIKGKPFSGNPAAVCVLEFDVSLKKFEKISNKIIN